VDEQLADRAIHHSSRNIVIAASINLLEIVTSIT